MAEKPNSRLGRFYANTKLWLSRRWGLALLSLVFAVLLWNVVITDADPLRTHDMNDISVRVDGLDALRSNKLTVKGQLYTLLPLVNVRMEMTRSELQRSTNANLDVSIDLSGITSPGVYNVTINASSPRGTVLSVSPGTVKVEVEELDSKIITVLPEIQGEKSADYWYGEPQLSATRLEVYGALSDMTDVDHARVVIDISGLTDSMARSIYYEYINTQGEVIRDRSLDSDVPNVIATLDILPKKDMVVQPDTYLLGSPADGYEVASIGIYPKELTIVGRKSLLDELDAFDFDPMDIAGNTEAESFSRTLTLPSGLYFLNGDQRVRSLDLRMIVHVSPRISELNFEKAPVEARGLARGLQIDAAELIGGAKVNCEDLFARTLDAQDLGLYIDCTGLAAGTYDLPVKTDLAQAHPQEVRSLTINPQTIRVNITR